MTRDEIRSLIGGYATSSLSAAERKALFEAALDDQELFDELAREQALKELLEEPGVRARLISALAPRQKNWWNKTWVWTAAGAFAAAVIAGVVLLKTPPQEKTVELAQVTAPASPVPPPIAAPQPAKPKETAPAAPRKAATSEAASTPVAALPVAAPSVASNETASAKPVPAPIMTPPAAAASTAVPRDAAPVVPSTVAPRQAAPTVAAAEIATVTAEASLLKTESGTVPPTPPPPANAPAALGFAAAGARAANGAPVAVGTAPGATPPVGGAVGGGARGGRGGGGGRGGAGGGRGGGASPAGAIAAQRSAVAAATVRFAFDYSLTPEGLLRITPAADGFLTVAVNHAAASTVLFSGRMISARSVTEVMLPADAVSATVIFAAQAAPPASPQAPQANAADAFIVNGATSAGATDPPSGTKSDPNPSPNSRLIAIIPVKR